MKAKGRSVLPGWFDEYMVRLGPVVVMGGTVAVFLPALVYYAVTGDGARAEAVLRASVGWGFPLLLAVGGATMVAMDWWRVSNVPPDRVTLWLSGTAAVLQWCAAAGFVAFQVGGPLAGARAGLLAVPAAAAVVWLLERSLSRRWRAQGDGGTGVSRGGCARP
ncbi:MAG: hypothetical protein ACOY3F_08035 [Bacillota bacterium]